MRVLTAAPAARRPAHGAHGEASARIVFVKVHREVINICLEIAHPLAIREKDALTSPDYGQMLDAEPKR